MVGVVGTAALEPTVAPTAESTVAPSVAPSVAPTVVADMHGGVPTVVVLEPDPARSRRLVEVLGPGVMAVATPSDLAGTPAGLVGRGLGPPVVVVVGPSLDPTTVPTNCPVVGVSRDAGPAALRHALAAGVCDLIDTGAPPQQLRHAVRRCGYALVTGGEVVRRPVGPPSHHEPSPSCAAPPLVPDATPACGPVVVLAPKGGAGGSTIAANLAVCLAQAPQEATGLSWPYPAVVMDADLQFGDVALMLGIEPRMSVADVPVVGDQSAVDALDATLAASLLGCHEPSGLGVLAAPVDPSLADTIGVDLVMAAIDAVGALAPWLVVDFPSRLDDTLMATLDRCHRLLLVTTPDLAAVKATRTTTDVLRRLAIPDDRWLVVCNAVGRPGDLGMDQIADHLGIDSLHLVPTDDAVADALARGVPVVLSHPDAPASHALVEVAADVAGGLVLADGDPPGTGPGDPRRPPGGRGGRSPDDGADGSMGGAMWRGWSEASDRSGARAGVGAWWRRLRDRFGPAGR